MPNKKRVLDYDDEDDEDEDVPESPPKHRSRINNELPLSRFLRVAGLSNDDAHKFDLFLRMETHQIAFGDILTMLNVGTTNAKVTFVNDANDTCSLHLHPREPLFINVNKLRVLQLAAGRVMRRAALHKVAERHENIWAHANIFPRITIRENVAPPTPSEYNITLFHLSYTIDIAAERIRLQAIYTARVGIRMLVNLISQSHEDLGNGRFKVEINAPMLGNPSGIAPEEVARNTVTRWLNVFGTQHILQELEHLKFTVSVHAEHNPMPLRTIRAWSLDSLLTYFDDVISDWDPTQKLRAKTDALPVQPHTSSVDTTDTPTIWDDGSDGGSSDSGELEDGAADGWSKIDPGGEEANEEDAGDEGRSSPGVAGDRGCGKLLEDQGETRPTSPPGLHDPSEALEFATDATAIVA